MHTSRHRRQSLVTAAFCLFAIFIAGGTWLQVVIMTSSSRAATNDDSASFSALHSTTNPNPTSIAEQIIQHSYRDSFGSVATNQLNAGSLDNKHWNEHLRSLLAEAVKQSSKPSSNATSKSYPWWFITMLRDATSGSSFLNAPWHNLSAAEPPIDFCSVEKVASTQWKKVFDFVNDGQLPMKVLLSRTKQSLPVSRVVILRDPLERLLSGYLNKCTGTKEEHCEPSSILSQPQNNDIFVEEKNDLTLKIRDNPKQLFAAYVDSFPLKWSMHFFPQSLYCNGLFLHIDGYDFVGRMDNDFYKDLNKLSHQFGKENRLSEALEEVFHLSTGLQVKGHRTHAPSRVKEFFTPASLRRALEYFAIDYVKLGLEVPQWANEMLNEDILTFHE